MEYLRERMLASDRFMKKAFEGLLSACSGARHRLARWVVLCVCCCQDRIRIEVMSRTVTGREITIPLSDYLSQSLDGSISMNTADLISILQE